MNKILENCRKQILVIDDDKDIRDTLAELLELEGFGVMKAQNGLEGYALLDSNEKPCMILLDLMMPVMTGWEFLKEFQTEKRAGLANIPLVVTSGAAELSGLDHQYNCVVLQKPVDIGRLLDLAQQHCLSH